MAPILLVLAQGTAPAATFSASDLYGPFTMLGVVAGSIVGGIIAGLKYFEPYLKNRKSKEDKQDDRDTTNFRNASLSNSYHQTEQCRFDHEQLVESNNRLMEALTTLSNSVRELVESMAVAERTENMRHREIISRLDGLAGRAA